MKILDLMGLEALLTRGKHADTCPVEIIPGNITVAEDGRLLECKCHIGGSWDLLAAFRQLVADQVDPEIPPTLRNSLEAYEHLHRETGGFLRACLENDFQRAACLADGANRYRLPAIARWMYENMAADCYGSPQKVADWLKATGRCLNCQRPVGLDDDSQAYHLGSDGARRFCRYSNDDYVATIPARLAVECGNCEIDLGYATEGQEPTKCANCSSTNISTRPVTE